MKEKNSNDIYIKKISDNPIQNGPDEKDASDLYVTSPYPWTPVYDIGSSKAEYVPRCVSIKLQFYCPTCFSMFVIERSYFRTTDKMTCFCGTKLKFEKAQCFRMRNEEFFYEIA